MLEMACEVYYDHLCEYILHFISCCVTKVLFSSRKIKVYANLENVLSDIKPLIKYSLFFFCHVFLLIIYIKANNVCRGLFFRMNELDCIN